MGGALGGIAKMAAGGGGGLGAAVLGGTKVGKLLSAFGGSGATPNPFSGLLSPAATGGQVPNYGVQTPAPGAAFSSFNPEALPASPTPQVQRGGYLSPPANAQTAIAQTRSQAPMVSPSQNEAFTYSHLRSKNLSPEAVSGIMGNLATESSFANDVLTGQRRGDNGASGFIAQWQGPRLRNLKAYAGTETPPLPQQLDFIFEEANPQSPYYDPGAGRAIAMLQNARTSAEAADIFRDLFERPSADDRGTRRGHAQRYFSQFSGTPIASAGAGTGVGAGGSVVIGGVSRPAPTGRFSQAPLPPGLFAAVEQAKLGGQGGDFAFGGGQGGGAGMQAGGAEQPEIQPPQDLGAQEVAGIQQGLTQKRLGEQQQSRQQTRKQELLKKTRGLS